MGWFEVNEYGESFRGNMIWGDSVADEMDDLVAEIPDVDVLKGAFTRVFEGEAREDDVDVRVAQSVEYFRDEFSRLVDFEEDDFNLRTVLAGLAFSTE